MLRDPRARPDVAEVPEIEPPETTLALEVREDLEVGHAMMIETIVRDVIVGQKIGPLQLVLLPCLDRIIARLAPLGLVALRLGCRIVFRRERDGQRQRTTIGERESPHPHTEFKRHGCRP